MLDEPPFIARRQYGLRRGSGVLVRVVNFTGLTGRFDTILMESVGSFF